MLGAAGWLHRHNVAGDDGGIGLNEITDRQALLIGLAQALALWPGVSRSLVTIVAGCLVGLTLSAAVELSFLLGFVLLIAASGLELLKHGDTIISTYGWVNPLVGLVVAFCRPSLPSAGSCGSSPSAAWLPSGGTGLPLRCSPLAFS